MRPEQIIITILAVISIWLSFKQNILLTKVKEKYKVLRDELKHNDQFPILRRETIITGLLTKGEVGYNVNKGYEIFICLDGTDENQVFHVLLHELAHTTVTEYKHSGNFWENLHKLKAVASRMGLYKGISRRPYCGKHISD
jgi:hypothetical protein